MTFLQVRVIIIPVCRNTHTKQKTEKYKSSTVFIVQRQVTKMSQDNKKIKARKLPATKTGFLIRTGSLIQPVLFLRNTATNYKILTFIGSGTRDSLYFYSQSGPQRSSFLVYI